MTFGIDFDGTFNAAPSLWTRFCNMAISDGHICVIVTYRPNHTGRAEEVAAMCGSLPVVFVADMANGDNEMWKPEAARRAGYDVDVWVDDNPQSISPLPVLLGHKASQEA